MKHETEVALEALRWKLLAEFEWWKIFYNSARPTSVQKIVKHKRRIK